MEIKYSVLMAVYIKENPDYFDIAIQSMLNQTIKPSEFIIVKDGPLTKELDGVIEKYIGLYPEMFTILSNERNIGLGPALRKGVVASKNEYIARMDSDDYAVPNRCEIQLKKFVENPKLDVVGSFEAEFIGDISNVTSVHRVPEYSDEIASFMKRRCALLHPTVIYKKKIVEDAGNYQETSIYPVYEDYDLFARMVFDTSARCYNIQDALYYIRTSDDFFERRGGKKYAKTALRFKWNLYRKGNISLIDFIISGFGQALVCVLPNIIRKYIYIRFLRGEKAK